MDDGRDRQHTRLEQIAQSLAIAVAAISASLALYREYRTLRRESSEDEALEVKFQNIESQVAKVAKAQQMQHLDNAEAREQLAQQLVDIRRRVRAQLGKAETANSVESNLRKAQNALESCGGQFSAPYPDVGISSSHRPPDDFLPSYTSNSSQYPQYVERHVYPLHTERHYNPPEDSGRYSPTGEPRYPPSRGGPPPSGYHYGNGGYSHGNQFGTRAYRSSRTNNPF